MKGSKTKLRALEPEDLDILYEWENDSSVWRASGTTRPYSREVLKQYIFSSNDIFTDKQVRFIIENLADGRPVGCVDIFDFEPLHQRAGVGIMIGKETDRDKGFASDALKVLVQYSFETLGLHQVYCNISGDNNASIRLFEKNGFVRAGIKKDWQRTPEGWFDEIFYQRFHK